MYEITKKKYPEQNVIYIRTRDSLYSMGKYISQLYKTARKATVEPAGPIFTMYYEKPTDPKSVDYEMALPVNGELNTGEIRTKKIGGENCIYLRLKGSYKQFEDAYREMSDYIEKNNIELSGPPREVYVRGPLFGILTFIPIMITDIYFPIKE